MLKPRLPAILLAAFLTAGCSTPAARAQTERCDSAYDMVVQVREQARPDISREQAERLWSLLNTATRMCSGSGSADAWYYRYLYALRLGDKKDADYALKQARLFNAEGLRRNDNPFAPVVAAKDIKLSPTVREKWALVIGIGQYQFPGIRKLNYTAKDAQDFSDLLTNPNYGRFKKSNVTLLTDVEATTTRIKTEIERLGEEAKPEDLVVIYISTHGSPRDLTTLDVNYIVTYDTNPNRLYTTSLPMVTVVKDASKLIRAQRMAIFLDTCFSGAATLAGAFQGETASSPAGGSKSAASGSKDINFTATVSPQMLSQAGEGGQGRVIISASQSNESSWESHELKNGIFTYYLIEALKQNKGLRPIGEVFNSLRDQVSQRVRAEKKQIQRPMMEPPDTKLDICIGVQPQSK